MTVLIFANPIAGSGRGRAIAQLLRNRLQQRGYRVEMFLSRADSVACNAADTSIRAAIVIGGDGTLRRVAQWAIDTAATVPVDPTHPCLPYPLLIVPMGTANLMGRHLGIAWNHQHLADEVLAALERRHIVHLDVARSGDGVFLLMATVGFDAWVVHELDRIRSGPIQFTSYLAPIAMALQKFQFTELRVTVDGTCVFSGAPALAAIGNVREYGTGFSLLPHARPDDRLLDVCVMPCSSRADLAGIALAAAAGEHLRREGVVYTKGRQILIESATPIAAQVDGEPAGFTPLEIDLLPGRIPFIVPLASSAHPSYRAEEL